MNVSIDVRGGSVGWDAAAIERLSLFTLRHMGVPEGCELSVSLVGEEEIRELNRTWRGIDAPTDVLSFECESPWGETAAEAPVQVGDVVICPDVVDAQRARFGTSFTQEASLMLVHSILHLLGYDHVQEEQAEAMEAKEKEILDSYGLTGIR